MNNHSHSPAAAEAILADLTAAVQHYFGLHIREATPINRGWLNLKWHIRTEEGTYLLKQYNQKRFALYDPADLAVAFSEQARLHAAGLPCPMLFAHDGRFLLESAHGERFLVMEFCEGQLVPPGKASQAQMYDLGRVTGQMHRLLNDGSIAMAGGKQPQFVPPERAQRLAHWHSVLQNVQHAGKTELQGFVEQQIIATEKLELSPFEALHSGWAHRDLWVDNLLFAADRVTAVLDFDRMKYDYPQLDVARAILSCALDEQLDPALARAFLSGYKEVRPVEHGYLTTGIQLLWYLESVWWITADMDRHSAPPARFAKEMIWLAKHLDSLPDLLGDL